MNDTVSGALFDIFLKEMFDDYGFCCRDFRSLLLCVTRGDVVLCTWIVVIVIIWMCFSRHLNTCCRLNYQERFKLHKLNNFSKIYLGLLFQPLYPLICPSCYPNPRHRQTEIKIFNLHITWQFNELIYFETNYHKWIFHNAANISESYFNKLLINIWIRFQLKTAENNAHV